MPTWRAWLLLTGLGLAGTLIVAWKKVPGFQDAVRVVWSEAKGAEG